MDVIEFGVFKVDHLTVRRVEWGWESHGVRGRGGENGVEPSYKNHQYNGKIFCLHPTRLADNGFRILKF